MGGQLSQVFPPKPSFTESALPSGSLKDKVYMVTGAAAGVGKELARLLYSLDGTVYMAGRSQERAEAAMSWIREAHPTSQGRLEFLHIELADLESIKPAAESFLAREKRLDVLFNNAGVMAPPQGSATKQGYELQLGTNCLGPFALTKLLTPLLVQTAQTAETGSVRVIWVSSSAVAAAPTGGLKVHNLDYRADKAAFYKYAVSKAGNALHALRFRALHAHHGVLSVALNPGNLKSELQRHLGWLGDFAFSLVTYPPVNGAYTGLFAGLAPQINALKGDEWVIPFGRVAPLRKDLAEAGLEGGNAEKFWDWSDEQVAKYL